MSEPVLEVKLGSLTLQNPVLTASGTFGYGGEYNAYFDLNLLGGIVVKGTTLEPWPGNSPPRIVETPSGMLNAVGLQNPGVQYFIETELPRLRALRCAVIVNIAGHTQEEYVALARRLSGCSGVDALELNVSCPNIKLGGLSFGTDAAVLRTLVEAVRCVTSLPLIVKLTPNVTAIGPLAAAAEAGGADAVSLINTLRGMVIDTDQRRPVLANEAGGLSGPAVRPLAVRMVWEAAAAVSIPLIGMGGITCGDDALQFMMAGATAVAVGTASFVNPLAAPEVLQGIKDYMKRHRVRRVDELIGAARRKG